MNLIFVGQADPLQIRAALLSLDGDRTAFGLPDANPVNALWSDANGDVQTTYAGNEEGTLTVTPWNIEANQPAGEPYAAEVRGLQAGTAYRRAWKVQARDSRLAHEPGGVEFLVTTLRADSGGPGRYQLRTRCLE